MISMYSSNDMFLVIIKKSFLFLSRIISMSNNISGNITPLSSSEPGPKRSEIKLGMHDDEA